MDMAKFTNDMDRVIHLDLKSCPLKIGYLKELFRTFAEWGGTGLLIEWEDTFPYRDELIDIGSVGQAAYTSDEIKLILKMAKEFNLEVIPLVQTFGHLEFVLKTRRWRHLREVPKYCSSLCPSNPNSYHLVTSMIAQIMELHVDSQFVHIGGDEVWHMGVCDICKPQDRHQLFLKHIVKVVEFVRQHYPQVFIIMWDDMLRGIDSNLLREFNLGELVEPMIWEYRPSETFALSPELWNKYGEVFEKIWIASAFKGATGSCQILPIIPNHIRNHEKWLEVLRDNHHRFKKIRGIAFTGWSRYDHYAVLCELMPAGLPSLALCLRMWLKGKFDESVYLEVSSSLSCAGECPLPLGSASRPVQIPIKCNFPSDKIYIGIESFANVRHRANLFITSDPYITWLNPWHVKQNHTSTMQTEYIIFDLKSTLSQMETVEHHLRTHMPYALYDHTIEEWLGCYLEPLKNNLAQPLNLIQSQLEAISVDR